MRILLAVLLVLAVAVGAAYAAPKLRTVTLQGQMVCLWCDVAGKAMPEKTKEPHACAAAFAANDGKVYTLVPDEMGKELGALTMHEQKVKIEGYILPNSQILEARTYKIVQKVKPTTPEYEPWFNF